MHPHNTIPEITIKELAQKLQTSAVFILLDVREIWETQLAQIEDPRVMVLPMSQIVSQRQEAFPPPLRDPQTDIVVMCHHGIRSAEVTRWMKTQGWQKVVSLAGGLDAYAAEIDASVGRY